MLKPDDSGIRRNLKKLTPQNSITTPVFVAAFVLFALDGILFVDQNEILESPKLLTLILTQTINSLFTFAILLLLRYTWLSRKKYEHHQAPIIRSFFIATLSSELLIASLSAYGLVPSNFAAGFINHVLYQTVALAVIAVVFANLKIHQQEVSALQGIYDNLLVAWDQGQKTLLFERRQIVKEVNDIVNETLKNIDDVEIVTAAESLRDLSSDVIRPLSHDLAEVSPNFSPKLSSKAVTPSWKFVINQVGALPLIAPLYMALTMMIIGFRFTVVAPSAQQVESNNPSGGVSVSVDLTPLIEAISVLFSIFLATYIAAWIGLRALKHFANKFTWLNRKLSNLIAILAIAVVADLLVSTSFILPWFPPAPSFEVWRPILFLIPIMAVAVVTGIVQAVEIRQRAIQVQLKTANEDLQWDIAKINETLWHERSRLSHALHGPIQAAVNAGTLKLQQLDKFGVDQKTSSTLISEIKHSIEESLLKLNQNENENLVFGEEISKIKLLWQGVCEIDFFLHPADSSAIESLLIADFACSAAAIDIIEEACTNSAVHGLAKNVNVSLELKNPRELRLTVADDGTGRKAHSKASLGSKLINEVSINWDLTHAIDGTTLVVDLPISSLN